MRALDADDGLRRRLAEAGRERARRFTWTATARSLLDLCRTVAAKRS
jgi:glycosyltransferase involved in cell wall biosynthesis